MPPPMRAPTSTAPTMMVAHIQPGERRLLERSLSDAAAGGETGPQTGTTGAAEARGVAWKPSWVPWSTNPESGAGEPGASACSCHPRGRKGALDVGATVGTGWVGVGGATGISRVASVAAGASGTGVVGASEETLCPSVASPSLSDCSITRLLGRRIPPDVVAAVTGRTSLGCHRMAGYGDEHASQGVLSAFLGPSPRSP